LYESSEHQAPNWIVENEINNNRHHKKEVENIERMTTLITNLLAQIETHFKALIKKRKEHEFENEEEDDVHSTHSLHEENPSPIDQIIRS